MKLLFVATLKLGTALIKAGAKVNRKGQKGFTPLHHAAFGKKPDMVRLLLEHGAEINALNNAGKTPLDLASGETAELLKEKGGKSASELK